MSVALPAALILVLWLQLAAASTGSDGSIADYLVQHLYNPKLYKLLHRKGSWPFFSAQSQCRRTATRDYGYYDYKQRGEIDMKVLWSTTSCGINMLTRNDGSSNSASDRFDILKRRLEEKLDEFGNRDTKSVDEKAGRVVGGHAVSDGSWPWLAAVGRKGLGPRCGGTLISDRWVVTAAHCFKDFESPCDYNIRLGTRNWLHDARGTHVDVTIEAIYRHPGYAPQASMKNDVALLKLSRPVTLDANGYVNAICLPRRSRSVPVGGVCLAAGWGRLEEGSDVRVFESREVQLPVLSYDQQCGRYRKGAVPKGAVCVGYLKGGRDTCQGDSGGPLVYRTNNQWTLLGITSFGQGCARAHYPGIYTDVGYHLNWVAAVINRFS